MSDDLFFIPLLAAALERHDTRGAIAAALQEIQRDASAPASQQGYRQFLQFMAAARDAEQNGDAERLHNRVDRIGSMELHVVREGIVVGRGRLGSQRRACTIEGIVPGRYGLRTDSGRILWEGHIAAEQVLWSQAYPRQALRAAADTGQPEMAPTRTVSVPQAGLVIQTHAGIEAGSVTIALCFEETT